jgi:Ser/Thr protein kinase RdoA (MazF antagonist)
MIEDMHVCRRIDLERCGRGAVVLDASSILRHTLKYYRHKRLLAHGSTPETAQALYRASYMMPDMHVYRRIDLERCGRGAVVLDVSSILRRTLKYYGYNTLLAHGSTPETAQALWWASYMMPDMHVCRRIDLERCGRGAVVLDVSSIL